MIGGGGRWSRFGASSCSRDRHSRFQRGVCATFYVWRFKKFPPHPEGRIGACYCYWATGNPSARRTESVRAPPPGCDHDDGSLNWSVRVGARWENLDQPSHPRACGAQAASGKSVGRGDWLFCPVVGLTLRCHVGPSNLGFESLQWEVVSFEL